MSVKELFRFITDPQIATDEQAEKYLRDIDSSLSGQLYSERVQQEDEVTICKSSLFHTQSCCEW